MKQGDRSRVIVEVSPDFDMDKAVLHRKVHGFLDTFGHAASDYGFTFIGTRTSSNHTVASARDDVERVCRALCLSGHFEAGEGTCALVCMDQLGNARAKPCRHTKDVFEKLAQSLMSAIKREA